MISLNQFLSALDAFLGYSYVSLGFLFLLIPILYIELGKPKDLFRAGVILFLGIFLIINKNFLNNLDYVIIILNAFLVCIFSFEVFSYRWNQLSDKEKIKLKTFSELIKNSYILINAIKLGLETFLKNSNIFKFLKKSPIKKKWIRSEGNNNLKNSELINDCSNEIGKKSTKIAQEDIIKSDQISAKGNQTNNKKSFE